jgi:YD repeat-containing protein
VRYQLGANVRDLSFDAAGRISAYTHYDAATGATNSGTTALNQAFGYDELGRLTSATMGTSTWAYAYDANGNRTQRTLGGTASIYSIASNSNRLNSITNPARSFTYNSAGSTTADTTTGDASASYTAEYGTAGRLDSLTKNGVVTSFDYAKGLRVRKFSSSGVSSTVLFAYDQAGRLLGEYDNAGTALREYVWLDDTPVAVFTPDAANTSNNPSVAYFIQADHLNTPRVVLDKSNRVRWRWMAEPLGPLHQRPIRPASASSRRTSASLDSTLTRRPG